MPRFTGPHYPKKLGTSLGAHARRLHEVLCEMRAEMLHDKKTPRFRIVCISDHICALERAYPEEFGQARIEQEVTQHLAEEDSPDGYPF